MGLFSFGGSKAKSSSFSESFSNLDSFGLNLGVSGSTNVSSTDASSRSGGEATQDIAFRDIFKNLFGGASNVAGDLAGRTDDLSGAANLLFSSGQGFLESLGEGGAGASFLEQRLSGGDSLVDDRIDLLREDLSSFLEEELNPAITARGVEASTLGGSRGQIARGQAAGDVAREFTRGAIDIRSRDQAQRDAIASTLLADETTRSATGIAALPGLFGLAESQFLSDLSPFAALSQIIGDPTVLTQSSEAAESSSISRALAEAFGLDIGVDSTTGRSASTSGSKSKSGSLSFGFG